MRMRLFAGLWVRLPSFSKPMKLKEGHWVAVGIRVAPHPPHRSVRALLAHTALTSDAWRQTAREERDARCGGAAASG